MNCQLPVQKPQSGTTQLLFHKAVKAKMGFRKSWGVNF